MWWAAESGCYPGALRGLHQPCCLLGVGEACLGAGEAVPGGSAPGVKAVPLHPFPVSVQWLLKFFWSPNPVFPHSSIVAESLTVSLSPVPHMESHLVGLVGGSPSNSNILFSQPAVGPAGFLEPQGPGRGPSTSSVAPGHPVSPLGQWSKTFF